MKNIYKGQIKKMQVSKIDLTKNGVQLVLKDYVVCKNSYFYKNIFGNIVNIEFDNVLASRQEAKDFVRENGLDIIFVDYNELEFVQTVNNKQLKLMKNNLKRRY